MTKYCLQLVSEMLENLMRLSPQIRSARDVQGGQDCLKYYYTKFDLEPAMTRKNSSGLIKKAWKLLSL